jgi:hypothetical protein
MLSVNEGKKMRSMTGFLAAALALFASSAFAEDFTFTVPVRIENMGHITGAYVQCAVYTARPAQISPSTTEIVPVSGGEFHGNVVVRVTLMTGYRREDVGRWACGLYYQFNDDQGRPFYRALAPGETTEGLYTQMTGQEVVTAHTWEQVELTR